MGGNAVANVGVIHKSEINSTLDRVIKELNLEDYVVLGSAGKKDWSGDLDIGVIVPQKQLLKLLIQLYGDDGSRKLGSGCSVAFDIVGYDDSLIPPVGSKRTGKVQVDFIHGDLDLLKIFYHSPKHGNLKGFHRNIAISSLAGITDLKLRSMKEDDNGFPINSDRWKWTPKSGLIYVNRRSHRQQGKDTLPWCKKQIETELGEPVADVKGIIKVLFGDEVTNIDYLDNAENIIKYVAETDRFSTPMKEQWFERLAHRFEIHPNSKINKWIYPKEIEKYIKETS